MRSPTADKGYFAIEEIAQIQEFDIRTVIWDAHCARRRKEGLAARCEKPLIAPLVPLRASLTRRFCASAACTWNAPSSTSLMKAECVRLYALQGLALLSLLGLALGVRQHRSPWPFVLGVASVVAFSMVFLRHALPARALRRFVRLARRDRLEPFLVVFPGVRHAGPAKLQRPGPAVRLAVDHHSPGVRPTHC